MADRMDPQRSVVVRLIRAARLGTAKVARAIERIERRLEARHKDAGICYLCGAPASWRIVLGGEDEPTSEEDACDAHMRGHRVVGGRKNGGKIKKLAEAAPAHGPAPPPRRSRVRRGSHS
jgi:hypothetical protein